MSTKLKTARSSGFPRPEAGVPHFLQNTASDGFWFWDLDTSEAPWLDPTGWTTLGYSPEELSEGTTFPQSFILPEDQHKWDHAVRDLRSHYQESMELVLRFRHARQRDIQLVRVQGVLIPRANRQVGYLAGTIQVLPTDQDNPTKDHLPPSWWLELEDLARVGGWEVNLEKDPPQFVCTQGLRRLLEFPNHLTLHPDTIFDYIDNTEMALALRNAIDLAHKEGEPWDLTLSNRTYTGRSIWVRTVGTPFMKSGRCIRIKGVIQDVTTQVENNKLAEVLRSTLNESEEAIFILGILTTAGEIDDFFLKDLNNQAEAFLNQARRDLIGKKMGSELFPDTIKHLFSLFRKVFLEKISHEQDITLSAPHPRSGSYVLRVAPLSDGVVVHQKTVKANFSESRRADVTVAHLGKMFQSGEWQWWIDSNKVTWGKRTHEIFGTDPDHFQPDAEYFFSVVLEEDLPKVQQALDYILENGQEYDYQHRICKPDGTIRHVRTWATPVLDHSGKPVRLIGTIIDVTEIQEQKLSLEQHRKQLHRLEKHYHSVLDSQAVYIIKTDREGRFTYMNDYFLSKFGFDRDLIGKDSMDSILTHDHPTCMATVEKCFEEPEVPHPVILKKTTHNGSVKSGKWEFKGMTNQKGEVEEILCVGFDITDQEESLEKMEHLLQISNDQNKRLKSFAYIVSHNIRSHVANISGLSGLLNESNTDVERSEYVNMLQTSVDQLDDTIHNLNEILTIQMDGPENHEVQNLKEAVEKVLDIFRVNIQSQDIEVKVAIDAGHWVKVIPAYLNSILLNLIGNAIKYRSPVRRLYIDLKSERVENGIVLSVKDTGLGIDMKKHGSHLFQLFKTFHHHPEARGVGLYLTKIQIEAMGGWIQAKSQVGYGTCFKVFFHAG